MGATRMKKPEDALASLQAIGRHMLGRKPSPGYFKGLQTIAMQMLGKSTKFIATTPGGSFLFYNSGKALALTAPKTKTNILDSYRKLAVQTKASYFVYVGKSPKSGKTYFVDAKGNVYEMAIVKNVKKSVPKRTR